MNLRRPGWWSVVAMGALALGARAAEPRPNIVLILADDLGYGDLRSYQPQGKIPTPALDRLATEGIRFTDAHAPAAVCTPTRYGLLTGRYAWRTWLQFGVLDGFDPPLIEDGRPTLASWLKARGYATACIGKWHLGMTWARRDGTPVPYRRPAPGTGGFRPGTDVDLARPTRGGPPDHGFEQFFGLSASLDMPPYAFLEGRSLVASAWEEVPEERTMFLNQSPGVKAQGFTFEAALPALTRRAVDFVASRAGAAEPFFLYFPLPSPHLPVVPNREWEGRSGAGRYGDFVAETDAAVGELLAAIDRAGLRANTLVIFTSDNGGLFHTWEPKDADDVAEYKPTPRGAFAAERGHRSNGSLRGGKGDIYEGGHRVPFIVRWPAAVKPGQVSPALVELNDVFATLAELLGAQLPADGAEDSFSFAAALRGQPPSPAWPARTFAVHHSMTGVFALRQGPWKFVPARGSGGFSAPKSVAPPAGRKAGQLYNLAMDPAEERNLFETEPAQAQELEARLRAIRAGTRTR